MTLMSHPPSGERLSSPRARPVSPNLRKAADPAAEPKPPTPWLYERITLEGRLRTNAAPELDTLKFDVCCAPNAPTVTDP